jgi:hypothetical protein
VVEWRCHPNQRGSSIMSNVIYLVVLMSFFALAYLLVHGLERLK